MRWKLIIVVGAASFLAASPALACRQLIPSAKFEHSDVVVDGEAACLETPGRCRLKISAVSKGNSGLVGRTIEISVDEAPPLSEEADGGFVARRCAQTFEPEELRVAGRFYLKFLPDRTLFAAHPVDARGAAQ